MFNYASREWLMMHLGELKLRLVFLKDKIVDGKDRDAKLGRRRKPWPRRRGLKTASGATALFRQ